MTVETKFNIGDEVFVLKGERAIKSKVTAFKVYMLNEDHIYQEFLLSCGQWWHEKSVFKTKEELIESLFS